MNIPFVTWRKYHKWRTKILLTVVGALFLYTFIVDIPVTEDELPRRNIKTANFDQSEYERIIKLALSKRDNLNPNLEHENDYLKAEQQTNDQNIKVELSNSQTRTKQYHDLWTWANSQIDLNGIFSDYGDVEKVQEALRTANLVNVDILDLGEYESGTSEKWVGMLEGGQKVMIKLLWDKDEKGKMKYDGACNFGFEIPTMEIAALHLHRILKYKSTVYVTGRKLDIRKEILPVASPQVSMQIIADSYNRTCVKGKCLFCKHHHYICPEDGLVEASVAYWVPRHLTLYTFPPKYMPFSTPRDDEWGHIGFNDRTYCKKARAIHPYEIDRYYYDLFDFAVLDTLMYHYDSKHYVVRDGSAAHGLTVRLDHGRTFCDYTKDDEDIFLAPIRQCCTLRRSTWENLQAVQHGELSRRLRRYLATDPLAPILVDKWYKILERRLKKIIIMVEKCAKANGGFSHVLVDD